MELPARTLLIRVSTYSARAARTSTAAALLLYTADHGG